MNTLAPPPEIKEVDFYKNPTILSRLILNQKYESAINRLQRFPEEVSTWVSSKRNPYVGRAISLAPNARKKGLQRFSSARYNLPQASLRNLDYSVRQLPIHVACANLLRAKEDKKVRDALESLIVKLVVTYPNSCHEVDHEGKLPLHEAIWHDAKVSTVSMMLMAAPLTLHARDKYGRAPLDLNRFRDGTNKDQINTMLMRGAHFWEQARCTAVSKMEERSKAQEVNETKYTRSSSESKMDSPFGKEPMRMQEPEKVQATTWLKLERRAVHLEQLLNGMYEKNYELGEMVEELTEQNMMLQRENDRLKETAPRNVSKIQDENEALRMQVKSLEYALADMAGGLKAPDQETVQMFEEKDAVLRAEVDELTSRNRTYQVEVERLELLLESFRRRLDDTSKTSISLEIPSIAEDETYTQADEQTVSRQEFDDLFGAIEERSHYATERFLARKVRRLQDQLDEKAQTEEVDIIVSRQENERLMRENGALVATLSSVPSFKSMSNDGQPPFSPNSKRQKAPKRSLGSRENSTSSFSSDNLDDIFRDAAAMYGGSSTSLSITESTRSMTSNTQPAKEEPFDTTSAVAEKGGSSTISPPSVATLSFPAVLIIAKRNLGKPLPIALDSALREASLSTKSTTLAHFLLEAERMFGNKIPSKVVTAITKAAALGLDGSVSTSSVSQLHVERDVEREVEKIMEEAERMNGGKISSEITNAVIGASVAHFQRKASFTGCMPQTPEEDFEVVFAEAQSIFGKTIPSDIAFAIRKASLSSMASGLLRSTSGCTKLSGQSSVSEITVDDDIASVLDEAERMLGDILPNALAVSFRSAAMAALCKKSQLQPIGEERVSNHDFQTILNETEKLYGKPIPRQLSIALRTASLSTTSFSFGSADFEDLFDSSQVHEPSIGEDQVDIEKPKRSSSSSSQHSDELKRDEIEKAQEDAFEQKSDDNQNDSEIRFAQSDAASEGGTESLDTDDDLDSVLQEAELLGGKKLSPELIAAWKKIAVPSQFSSMASADDDMPSMLSQRSNYPSVTSDVHDVVGIVTDDLQAILSEAAHLFSNSEFPPVIPEDQSERNGTRALESKKSMSSLMSEKSKKSRSSFMSDKSKKSNSSFMSEGSFASLSESDQLDDLYAEAAVLMNK